QPLKIEEVDLDPPGPGEVLVKVMAAGLCHSDLSAIEGVRPRKMPYVPGHEASGIVEEVGEGVTRVKPGDHAVLFFVPNCGTCLSCDRGEPYLCDTAYEARSDGHLITGNHKIRLNGEVINHTSGVSCYSEYMVLAEGSVIPIEKDIPLEDAALFGCAVITGVGAVVNTAAIPPGATVAVLGLGGVGLNAMMAATLSGAEQVIAVDVQGDKLAFARQLGATDTVNASDPDAVEQVKVLTKGGVDYAVELAGVPAALEAGYAMCRRGGTVVTAGLPRPEATLDVPIAQLVSDNRTIKGSYMGSCVPRRDIPRFLSLYRQGKLPVDRLRSGFVDFKGLNAGFDRLAAGDAVRQVLRP
ncbi:MAG: zinc-dependent alcohol dehydrogenase family protein, partial [Pseudomonadota bacterium]|nr:zinc-dependent alcohol dehydrogenase family protein [Pseudomonadota bacterium]